MTNGRRHARDTGKGRAQLTGKRAYPGVNGKEKKEGREREKYSDSILLYIRFSTELSNPLFVRDRSKFLFKPESFN